MAWGLTEEALRRLDRFESRRYRRVRRTVEIEGRGSMAAELYVNTRPGRERAPSRRYLELLARGAEEHGLPAAHVTWLRAHPAGDSAALRALTGNVLARLHRRFDGS